MIPRTPHLASAVAARRRRIVAPLGRRTSGTNWGRTIIPQVAVAAGTKVLLATFVLSNVGIGEVVRRTRGQVLVLSDQASVVEQQNGAFGMVVVTDLAAAAGAASIPGPVTDANDDGWFVWVPTLQATGGLIGGAPSVGVPQWPHLFDSKAMRRVEEGFVIAVMFEGLSQGSTVGFAASLLSSRIG